MKNKILLFSGFLVLLLFLSLSSYYWYTFFININSSFNNNSSNTNNEQVIFEDNSKKIVQDNASITNDSDVSSITPYKFEVKNTASNENKYIVYIEDVLPGSVNDGCTEETFLSRDMLKYQLIMNDEIIKEEVLSNVQDNILDSRSIASNTTNNYELRIYIHSESEDFHNKHYHYKIVLKND